MKYYHPIPINNLPEIQLNVLKLFPKEKWLANSLFYLRNNLELMFSIPELKNAFDALGWTRYVGAFAFYVRQKTSTPFNGIHIDSGDSFYSFNIPIIGCNGTHTQFFNSSAEPILKTYTEYEEIINYYYIDPLTCTKVDSFELTIPHVIKVKEIHNVYNPNTTPRISLLARLSNDLPLDHLFTLN